MPLPTQWNSITPNFSGSTAQAGVANENFKEVGNIAQNYLLRKDRQAAEEERKKERQQDVDYRQKQADTMADQWGKDYLLKQSQDTRAQAQEGRAATEEGRKLLGQNMMSNVDAATADVMNRGALTPKGQQALLGKYDQLVKSGMSPADAGIQIGAAYDTNQGGIRQVPIKLKDKIAAVEGINLGQGELQYDPTMALNRKDTLLSSLRSDYQKELDRAQQMDMLKSKMSFEASEGAKNRAVKEERFTPYNVTVGFTQDGQPTSDPSKIAYKSAITVNSPRVEQAVQRGYGKALQLGTVTDFIPNGSGKGKGSKLDLYSASPEAAAFREKVGSSDMDRANRIGQRLQNTFKLTPAETASILDQATGTFLFDTEIKNDRLRDVLYNMGYLKGGKSTSKADSILKQLTTEE